ncbi:DNA topoisomerase III [Escherichia coli]|uniref:DNA topoisomerase III n=1 Tax=Escherichia coli TaxID=562 RepID=UPI000D1270F8|nr:DNA topoisomerase III [Escherichia coli]EER5393987.1 DNA topoisomerase III [Escherichia coli]EER9149172.1 DNA topoisomerase III [Escherichia coli]EEU2031736.1 DNA topoisomerase III [Escherichia coli]EFA0374258.1 DNA topoisomerase III [Escherichia coli]EFE9078836.1 DNA topoisomerase III [Escherichia coli]
MRLFLCEKPSQASDIARVLGAARRGEGLIEGNDFVVTWAFGHLLEQAPPEAYGEQYGSPWIIEVLPVIPEQWQMVVKDKVARQFNVIRRLLGKADEVVIATDADREGEIIARELLDYCGYTGVVRRLWLSALDESSIREALGRILPGEETERLYEAGKGRSRADWLTGINLTRLYTMKARECGVSGVLSIGRVQTPTLAMVVRRDAEIKNFIPVPYWQLNLWLEKDNVRFRAVWVAAEQYCDAEKRCVNVQAATSVQSQCRQAGVAVVREVSSKREKTPPPLCFSLGTLQEVCSKKFGLGAQAVLDIAQSLYEKHKATTYPRTDCGYLPVSMHKEVPEVLAAVANTDPDIAPELAKLSPDIVSRVWNDKKITAHHAIIPTRQAFNIGALSDNELRVYRLIRQHYLAQFLPVQEADVTEATFVVAGQLFGTRGRVEVVKGWRALFIADAPHDEDEGGDTEQTMPLPVLAKGDECRLVEAELKEMKTTPPRHYTEGTLIAAMKNAAGMVSDPALKKVLRENAGLGTEATRAEILETLFTRKYIEKQGKHIRATQLGAELIAGLPEVLTSPGTTALWEQALDDIAQGKLSLASFMEKQKQWLNHLVSGARRQQLQITAPVTPACPLCQGRMRKLKGKNGEFWSCQRYPECKGVISEQKTSHSKRGGRKIKKRG